MFPKQDTLITCVVASFGVATVEADRLTVLCATSRSVCAASDSVTG